MLKKGDKVIIVGSGHVDSFTKGIVLDIFCDMYKIRCNKVDIYVNETHVFKDTKLNLFLLKLFRRKEYVKYRRTN
jgi:hypothetical protein